jgi:hypothetical protein
MVPHTRGIDTKNIPRRRGFEEALMKDNEKDLLKTFGKLTPENRASLLAFAHVTHEAQENKEKQEREPA